MMKKDKNTKVILTVRDNDDVWWNSYCSFMRHETRRYSFAGFCMEGLMNFFGSRGYMGEETRAMIEVGEVVVADYLSEGALHPGLRVESTIRKVTSEERKYKSCYNKHNLYVMSVVPKKNLLVWNIKEGWEPLCRFLEKPVPEVPVPYDNKTGTNFMEEYAWQSSILKHSENEFNKNMAITVTKIGILSYLAYKEYRSG